MKNKAPFVTAQEFESIWKKVCNWGRWGEDDERGTLNYITPAHVQAAARLVRLGASVSMAIPINTTAGPDNPRPPVRHIVRSHDIPVPQGEPRFAGDYLGTEFHGDCHTHIDALCHISFKGRLYNGKPATSVSSQGPTLQDITAYAHGIVGRGVLLDIPRLRGVAWVEPGEAIMVPELEAAERAAGVTLGQGDIFVFRTGHHRRRLELGAWNNDYDGEGKAGIHPTVIPWLHERKIAAFFPDGDGEAVPCNTENMSYPIHALQIGAMGMCCADSLQFEELAPLCERERRWEFMVVASPLRLPGGTGSLFNPLAIF